MKKSQLRHIIRESIKELINEQSHTYPNIGQSCPNGFNSSAWQNAKGPGAPCYSNNSWYGLTSNFINNMNNGYANANDGCSWLDNKKSVKRNSLKNLQQTLVNGKKVYFCNGENPNWQTRLFNQIRWIGNKLNQEMAAGNC